MGPVSLSGLGGTSVRPERGMNLYRYALHIIELFDEMEQKIKDWDHCGTLRIGASITIGTHIR